MPHVGASAPIALHYDRLSPAEYCAHPLLGGEGTRGLASSIVAQRRPAVRIPSARAAKLAAVPTGESPVGGGAQMPP
jgi:hypothetical protein